MIITVTESEAGGYIAEITDGTLLMWYGEFDDQEDAEAAAEAAVRSLKAEQRKLEAERKRFEAEYEAQGGMQE